jgi:hypothetical protein
VLQHEPHDDQKHSDFPRQTSHKDAINTKPINSNITPNVTTAINMILKISDHWAPDRQITASNPKTAIAEYHKFSNSQKRTKPPIPNKTPTKQPTERFSSKLSLDISLPQTLLTIVTSSGDVDDHAALFSW